jgi:hypothetical protein
VASREPYPSKKGSKMTNAIYSGEVPLENTIREMQPGDHGYTVPWAFNPTTNTLDERFTIGSESFGTQELRVDCVVSGVYRVRLVKGAHFRYTLDPAPAKLS